MAEARKAVDALEQACAPVTRHFGDTVDWRRLQVDIPRLRDDLNLLCGAAASSQDTAYATVFWDDGYEGMGGGSGRTAP